MGTDRPCCSAINDSGGRMAAGGCVSESLHVCVELKNSYEFQEIEM